MLIYLICFSISVGLAYQADRTKRKELFYLYSCLSILIMVLLAGLRDYSVGIDTSNYKTHYAYWYLSRRCDSVLDYLGQYLETGYVEVLFALFLGLVQKITNNFSVLLFLMHAIIVSGIYIGAFRLKKYVEPAWVLLLYYLFFFNQSLNLTRQHMVMAILFVFFADILEGKWVRYCIAVAVAMFIHTTAVLAFIYPMLYFILNWKWPLLDKKRWYRGGIIISLVALALILFKPLGMLCVKLGILSQKYDFFFSTKLFTPALLQTLFVVAGLAAVFYFRKEMAKKCDKFEFLAISSVLYTLLLQCSWIIIYGKRLSLYCALPNLALIALIESAQTEQKKKWIVRGLILGAGLLYWFYVYVFNNASETVPYSFVFLK